MEEINVSKFKRQYKRLKSYRKMAEKYNISLSTVKSILSSKGKIYKVRGYKDKHKSGLFPLWEVMPDYNKTLLKFSFYIIFKYHSNKSAEDLYDFLLESLLRLDTDKNYSPKEIKQRIFNLARNFIFNNKTIPLEEKLNLKVEFNIELMGDPEILAEYLIKEYNLNPDKKELIISILKEIQNV